MKIVFPGGFIIDGNLGFLVAFLLVLILSIVVSGITYNLIEKPGINLGRLLIKRL